MDTVLLFALPLVGGLIFCSKWNVTRWRVAREDGHRLYFRAVLFGALLFAFIAGVNLIAESFSSCYYEAINFVKRQIEPMAKEKETASAVANLTVVCFMAMLAGWPLAWLLNLSFKKDDWLRKAIKEDPLEAFLLDAADKDASIAITMDDRKVYVGFVVSGFDPAIGRKCIFLLPLVSGYRNEVHKVNFTTFYTDLYGGMFEAKTSPLPNPLGHLTAEDFITVLPVDRIASYRLFDALAYREFQKNKPSQPPSVPSVDTSAESGVQ